MSSRGLRDLADYQATGISLRSGYTLYTQQACFQCFIPHLRVDGGRGFEHCTLKITYNERERRPETEGLRIGFPPNYAILAAQHLPSLVRVINSVQELGNDFSTRDLSLFFRSGSVYFRGNNRTTSFLLENCKKFRQICWNGDMVELAIDGDVTVEQIDEINSATKQSMNLKDLWEEINAAIAEADDLLLSGDYLTAHGRYLLADHLMKLVSGGRLSGNADTIMKHEYMKAYLRIISKLAFIDRRLEYHNCACPLAERCLIQFDISCPPGSYPDRESDKAAMRKAISEFEAACALCPLDDSIAQQLQELKARHGTPPDVVEV
ncbi:hypothetical protein V8E51_019410 [Hyaloscypha variabilis]